MSQPLKELEEFYQTEDPWQYRTTEDDLERRQNVVHALKIFKPKSILEIGAGEGFITEEIMKLAPTDVTEISDTAAARLPKGIERISGLPKKSYDTVVALGVLYSHYDYHAMRGLIKMVSPRVILVSHYTQMEAHDEFDRQLVYKHMYPYRKGHQIMKVYK